MQVFFLLMAAKWKGGEQRGAIRTKILKYEEDILSQSVSALKPGRKLLAHDIAAIQCRGLPYGLWGAPGSALIGFSPTSARP